MNPDPPLPSGHLTRLLAIEAVSEILQRRRHADVVLAKLDSRLLETLDRAFVHELVLGSLRWLSRLDALIAPWVTRPLPSLDPVVVTCLRVGAYQLLAMDRVPPWAAVGTTVGAAGKLRPAARGLVNAVLRKVAGSSAHLEVPLTGTTPQELASQAAHPLWMVERWSKTLSPSALRGLLAANNNRPTIHLRKVSPRLSGAQLAEEFAARGIVATALPLPGAFRLSSSTGLRSARPLVQGEVIVQDEGAQLVTALISPRGQVLDACAAPGGKAIGLWASGLQSKSLTLCERSPQRARLLRENLTRVGCEPAEVLIGDAGEVTAGRRFNTIVVDAPCSGLGVLRRHPEAKWALGQEGVAALAREQTRLLGALMERLSPGGELVYIVCSFEEEETTEVVKSTLGRYPELRLVPLGPRVPSGYEEFAQPCGTVRIVPHPGHSMDGFFAAAFCKP